MSMKRISPYLAAVGTAVRAVGWLRVRAKHATRARGSPAAQGTRREHQPMMATMQAEQKKLDDLVAQMNAAKRPEKVDRIAAVVTEMASMHTRIEHDDDAGRHDADADASWPDACATIQGATGDRQ
jgi:hypothetical protein